MKDLDDCSLFELFERAEEIDDLRYLTEQMDTYLETPENYELGRYIGGSDFGFDEIEEINSGEIEISTRKPRCGRGCCPSIEGEATIPISWFEDRAWEQPVVEHFKQIEEKKKANERELKKQFKRNELRELKRLKEKYEKEV